MDTLTKKQRNYCMAQIKSKWTSCERKLHNYLKGNRIHHKMHPIMEGNPDIFLQEKNRVVFVQGCFWHRCPKCYREPSSNKEYWVKKIESNVRRDRRIIRKYKKNNYSVVIIWEHEIRKNIKRVLRKLIV